MTTINLEGTSCEVTRCINCGVPYTVPEIVMDTQRRDGGFHFCPNGHVQGWDDNSEINKMRRERDRLKQEQARLIEERDQEMHRAETAERRVLQVRRRAAAGVCPCCSRTFQNVQRHIASKHQNVVPLNQKSIA